MDSPLVLVTALYHIQYYLGDVSGFPNLFAFLDYPSLSSVQEFPILIRCQRNPNRHSERHFPNRYLAELGLIFSPTL